MSVEGTFEKTGGIGATLKKLYSFSPKAILLNIVSWFLVIYFGFVMIQQFAAQYGQGLSFLTVFIATAITYFISLGINYGLFKLLDKYGHGW